jgi:hypothetical protein
MARLARVVVPGIPHHVTQCGNGHARGPNRGSTRMVQKGNSMHCHLAWVLVVLVSGWVLSEGDSFARAQSPSVSADLAFLFDCKESYPSALDEPIERFLTAEGFNVLNQSRVIKERGVRANFAVMIFGLNKKRHIITFNAIPPMQGRYSASLITQPPTHRESALEEALLKFVSNQLGCVVDHITRGDNGAASSMIAYCFW